jgi:KEOPS complex subunit Cgi121
MDIVMGAAGRWDDLAAVADALKHRSGGQVVLLDASMVVGEDHLRSAILHARRAMSNGTSSSDQLALEMMVYASGERQISKAKGKMTPSPGADLAVVTLDAKGEVDLGSVGLSRRDDVLRPSREKARAFGISEEELEASGDDWPLLVLERVAMVEVLKR